MMRFLRALAHWLYAETLEGMLVNIKGLSLTHQILTVAGYLAVMGFLAVTLLVEVLGPNQPSARYIIQYSAFWASQPVLAKMIGQPLSLPWLALAGVLLAFALGWTYLLSGATDCPRRIFLLILVFFIFQIFFTVPFNLGELSNTQLALMTVRCLCLPAALVILAVGFVFTYRSPRWQKLTWLKWAISLALMLGILFSLMIFNPQPESIVFNFAGILCGPLLLTIPWWLVSGLTGVDLVMRIGRLALTSLRRLLPVAFLQIGSVTLTLAHPLAAAMIFALKVLTEIHSHPETTGDSYSVGVLDVSLLFEVVLALPLALFLGWLLVSKRWTERNALRLLALNFALPFFTLTISLALLQHRSLFDIVELVSTPVSALAPMLAFVTLMAYSALSLGAGFANSDGRLIPRRARVQLGLGGAMLIIAFTLFFTNLHLPTLSQGNAAGEASLLIDSSSLTTSLTALSLTFLGFPYLLWTLWKHPQRLLGSEPGRPAILVSLDTRQARVIAAAALAFLALGGLCLCCCVMLVAP